MKIFNKKPVKVPFTEKVKNFFKDEPIAKKKKEHKVLKTFVNCAMLGIGGYMIFLFGKEVSKEEIRAALMNVDFVADFGGKKPITMGINSMADIVDNTILLFPKK